MHVYVHTYSLYLHFHIITVGNWQNVSLSLPLPWCNYEGRCQEYKDCSYQRMLEKCIAEVYAEEEWENAEFYIADSHGIPIWSSDTIKIDVDEGTEELEWTLNHYIHLSNAKYPSKVRYYCVHKGRWYYCTVVLTWAEMRRRGNYCLYTSVHIFPGQLNRDAMEDHGYCC